MTLRHIPKNTTLLVLILVLHTSFAFNLTACNAKIEDARDWTNLPTQFECIPLSQAPQTAKVVSVIDGDTIKVEVNNQRVNLRYIGINTPELDSNEREIAMQALQFNAQLVENQSVILYKDTSETDRFGRLLRYVLVDDIFVNYELVRMGFARQKDYPPDSACKDLFVEAEQEAIANQRGMWKTK